MQQLSFPGRCLAALLLLAAPLAAQAQTPGVGIGTTTPNGQFEVMGAGTLAGPDQQSTGGQSSTVANSYWQSFTAGRSGALLQLAVYGGAGNNAGRIAAPALLEVFGGTGTGGTLLASQNFTLAGYINNTTPTTVSFAAPTTVVAGQVYTFRVSLVNPDPGVYGLASLCTNNCYGGGSMSVNGSYDANFQTTLGASGPQSALLVQGGNVGIGTTSPTATLHVGGANSTIRLDGLASGSTRMVTTAADGTLGSTALPTGPQQLSVSGSTLSITNGNSVTLPTGTDNLGNHTATQNLNLAGNQLVSGGSTGLAISSSGSVGIGTTTPNASAVLDVSSTTKGLLPPRMSTTQRDAINPAATAAGLTIYNTTTGKLNTWNGTSWDQSLSTTEQPYQAPAVTFGYTGAEQTYTVPSTVTHLMVEAQGAAGGSGTPSGTTQTGGRGARVQATLTVTPGQVLRVQVGGQGTFNTSGSGTPGGYNGGGTSKGPGGSGGGASDVRSGSGTLADRLLVAAGGGGGGYIANGTQGGDGGAPNGGSSTGGGTLGTGATQSAGGSANGGLGTGGGNYFGAYGGGGGGYYGGGAGENYGGGGGGSSWVTPTGSTAIAMTSGYNNGNGLVIITPAPAYAAPALDGSNFVNLNVSGDNLGNHTATQNLNLGSNLLVGNGSSTGVAISSTGNVGIGTSAPLSRLSISQVTAISPTAGQNLGELSFVGFNRPLPSASVQALSKDYDDTGHLLFKTSPGGSGATERLRITADGSVGIGTTDPQAGLHIDRPESGNSTVLGVLLGGGTTGNPSIELRGSGKIPYIDFVENINLDYTTRLISQGGTLNLNYGGAAGAKPAYIFNVAGGIQCTAFSNTSDARFKQHVRPLSSALAGVLALRGVRYDWNRLGVAHGGTAGVEQVGLLAQEVEKIYPELVTTGPDGYKGVNYAQLTPVLIEALKEQQQQIEALKARAAQAEAGAAADHATLQAVQTAAAAAAADLETMKQQLARLLGEAAPAGTQARK